MIHVTKPFLPPKQEYDAYVSNIWQRNWLTNNGPLVNELELKLKDYLDVPHLLYVSNGTIALQLAIKALDLKGEIITTPFSYVATTSSIVWEGCTPVFVDIDPETFDIDPAAIEQAITPKTSAILATHVYGIPCDTEKIELIAKKHNLKLVYDAAHAFGVKVNGRSIFGYGDISTASFHSTKLFHTVEGGAMITNDKILTHKMSWLRNFGHDGYGEYYGCGINGKNSEFHAAMGVLNLNYIEPILNKRKELSLYYDKKLASLKYSKPLIREGVQYNYAYYPVLLESEEVVLRMVTVLNNSKIYPRRYFYPALNTLNYVGNQTMPIAEDISKRILCLPLYHDLTKEEIELIARLMLREQNN